jgi:hypothetical protein
MWFRKAHDPFQCNPLSPGAQKVSQKSAKSDNFAIDEKDVVHPPGVEPDGIVSTCRLELTNEDYYVPGPIAWKAIILPLDQECLMANFRNCKYILHAVMFKHAIVLIVGAARQSV